MAVTHDIDKTCSNTQNVSLTASVRRTTPPTFFKIKRFLFQCGADLLTTPLYFRKNVDANNRRAKRYEQYGKYFVERNILTLTRNRVESCGAPTIKPCREWKLRHWWIRRRHHSVGTIIMKPTPICASNLHDICGPHVTRLRCCLLEAPQCAPWRHLRESQWYYCMKAMRRRERQRWHLRSCQSRSRCSSSCALFWSFRLSEPTRW